MMSRSLYTPFEIAIGLADRVRALRLARSWTQAELAERAGVALPTLKLFEQTGKISLDRLLRVASVLGALEDFLTPFAPAPARSLKEIEARTAGPTRRYGRRRPASPGSERAHSTGADSTHDLDTGKTGGSDGAP